MNGSPLFALELSHDGGVSCLGLPLMSKRKGTRRILAQIEKLDAERIALAVQLIASKRTAEVDASDEAAAARAGVDVDDYRIRRIADGRQVLERRISMLRQALQP